MSLRLLKNLLPLRNANVTFNADDRMLVVKGAKGTVMLNIAPGVKLDFQTDGLMVSPVNEKNKRSREEASTTRVLINNALIGVLDGYEQRLLLEGVGYRAAVDKNRINFTLGFSHPVVYICPEGVQVESSSQTELLLKAADKQKIGLVVDQICALRPENAYKLKGVRRAGYVKPRKEVKKKK